MSLERTRKGHLALIKLQVRAGIYQVNPEAVAEAMLNPSQDLGKQLQEERCEVRALDYNGVSRDEIARRTGLSKMTVSRIIDRHSRPFVQRAA